MLAALTTIFISLTLSGCVGLTGAGTPAANQSTNNSSSTGSLAANATSFTFGNVATGSSSSKSLTLTNTGTAAVTISQGTITGTGFTVVGGISTMSIQAGQSRTFQIQFVPQTTGAASGSLTIATGGSSSSLDISLSGTGMTPLAITTPPSNQSVLAGQTATFSVAATGSGTVTYQWKKNGASIGGATYASYTTPATTASDNAAQFTVSVSDNSGGSVSATATLSVTSAPVAPSITTQPASHSVNVGQTATFTVAAAGTATLTYQWSKNGSAIGGATSASYTTPATTVSDNGASFMATVSNSAGSIITNTAILTVTVPPAITTQPASHAVNVGQTATFTVAATGTPTLSYQWLKNGAAISGATSTSYTTPATAGSDNGALFTVTVTNGSGNVTSNAATLTVNVPPSISAQPSNQTVNVGQTANFAVTATGTATLTYQWKKNGTAISGATSASYTTPATASSDSGSSFTVTVTNSFGNSTSNAASLTVNVPPTITAQPGNQTVAVGQTATFTVAATGSGTLIYQWRKNGTAISGATSASYTTPATAGSDNGSSFTVTVTGSTGNITSNSATLTVNAPPAITSQPANQTVNSGQAATFTVTASGTATLTYQWSKNGSVIGGATSASYTTPVTSASDSGSSFAVTVTNGSGSITSNTATLTVNVVPTITSQPVSQTVAAGQTATFSVSATGSGTLTYQWKKNGTAIGGATSPSYTTPATSASDSGALFTVTVTGTSGITSNAATLTVNVPPSITAQPVNKNVMSGQTATFNVTASGTATLTYQWSKNGSAIGGATSASYTTPATGSSDNGAQFTVTVTNAAGSATSNAATLTVNTGTYILNASTSSLGFSSVTIGGSSTLGVTFTNAGNSNVTISGVSISGAGYTASGVSSGQILTPGQTATLNVTFTPASAGSLPGSATVTSNATNSPSTISFTGTGVQPVSHAVTLNWGASTSSVAGYNVYRSTVSGGPYTKQNSSLISTTSYTDSSVQGGQTYFYVVTSVDSTSMESTFSNEVSATIPTP